MILNNVFNYLYNNKIQGFLLSLNMKTIDLKNGHYVMVDDLDYDLVYRYKWRLSKGRNTNYACTCISGQTVLMHRLINKTPSGLFTDHINRNGLDNRRNNLRSVNRSDNGRNRDRSKDKRIINRKGKKQWNFLLSGRPYSG